MAKLRMKKIELIAMLTDSKKIIELLQRRGVVEICSNNDDELMDTNVTAVVGEFEKFRSTAAQALDILETYAPEKGSITDMFGGRTEVATDTFGKEAMKMEKVMNISNDIINSSRTITDAESTIAQLNVKIDTMKQWSSLDVPMNFKVSCICFIFI